MKPIHLAIKTFYQVRRRANLYQRLCDHREPRGWTSLKHSTDGEQVTCVRCRRIMLARVEMSLTGHDCLACTKGVIQGQDCEYCHGLGLVPGKDTPGRVWGACFPRVPLKLRLRL